MKPLIVILLLACGLAGCSTPRALPVNCQRWLVPINPVTVPASESPQPIEGDGHDQ